MHILLVSNYAPPYSGGIQFVMDSLMKEWGKRGHHVSLIACDTGIPTGITERNGVTLYGVRAWNGLERHSIPFPVFQPIALWRTLRDVLPKVDAVHLHGMLYQNCALAAWMAHRAGLPVILTEHVGAVAYRQALVRWVQAAAIQTVGRWTSRHANVVTVLNQRVFDEMRAITPEKTPVVKIMNGVDAAQFYPATPTERTRLRQAWGFDRPTALFVGRLSEKKGVPLFVEAAQQLPDIACVVCGKDTEQLQSDAVRVVGLVDRDRLRQLYQAADVLVLPSEGEGFPLVVQEAMSCGLPVIVTDNPENREYLDETVAVFTHRDPISIANDIRALLQHPSRRQHMAEAAHRHARHVFDWAHTVDALLPYHQGKATS